MEIKTFMKKRINIFAFYLLVIDIDFVVMIIKCYHNNIDYENILFIIGKYIICLLIIQVEIETTHLE